MTDMRRPLVWIFIYKGITEAMLTFLILLNHSNLYPGDIIPEFPIILVGLQLTEINVQTQLFIFFHFYSSQTFFTPQLLKNIARKIQLKHIIR